jgi:hypothetical protein
LDNIIDLISSGRHVSNGTSPHNTIPYGSIAFAKKVILFVAYFERDNSPKLTIKERNAQICKRYAAGETLSDLACEFGLSPQRIYQIIRAKP